MKTENREENSPPWQITESMGGSGQKKMKKNKENINVTCNKILSVYRTYLRRGDRRD